MKWTSVVILNDYYICIISTFGLLSLQLFTIINKGSLSNISFVSLCGFRGGLVCLFLLGTLLLFTTLLGQKEPKVYANRYLFLTSVLKKTKWLRQDLHFPLTLKSGIER